MSKLKFYIKREETVPEYFNGWNDGWPCWSDRITTDSGIDETWVLRDIRELVEINHIKNLTILVSTLER